MRLSMVRSYGTSARAVEGRISMFVHILVLIMGLMTAVPALAEGAGAGQRETDQDGGPGRFLKRRLRPRWHRGVPGTPAKSLGCQGDKGRYDQCRGVRRYRLGRPRPARLVDPGGNRGRDRRTRRQRCLARHRSRGHPRGAVRHPDPAEGAQESRSCCAAWWRRRIMAATMRLVSTRSIRNSRDRSACRSTRSSSTASPPTPSSIRPTECIRLAEGVDVIVKNILPTVEAFLGTISGQRS